MCIRCYEESYKTFGRCLFIENKCIRVGVTIDVGPRVIYFSLIDRENVMFNDTKRFLLRKTSILEHGMPMADTDFGLLLKQCRKLIIPTITGLTINRMTAR